MWDLLHLHMLCWLGAMSIPTTLNPHQQKWLSLYKKSSLHPQYELESKCACQVQIRHYGSCHSTSNLVLRYLDQVDRKAKYLHPWNHFVLVPNGVWNSPSTKAGQNTYTDQHDYLCLKNISCDNLQFELVDQMVTKEKITLKYPKLSPIQEFIC